MHPVGKVLGQQNELMGMERSSAWDAAGEGQPGMTTTTAGDGWGEVQLAGRGQHGGFWAAKGGSGLKHTLACGSLRNDELQGLWQCSSFGSQPNWVSTPVLPLTTGLLNLCEPLSSTAKWE